MKDHRMKIHGMITLVLAAALIAGACGGSDAGNLETAAADVVEAEATATQEPTTAPTPVPTAAPTAVPEPTLAPTAAPTAEPTVEPTAVPAPETSETADLVSGCASGTVAGTTTVIFEFEGVEREYEQVVPASYDDTTPMPVVLNWHGLGSNGIEQVGFSEYATLADAKGFIVIAPTGLPTAGDNRNSWELTADDDLTRDDLAFANTLLDRVIETLCVDDARVYTTGMSNGGYFSSVLVCEMSDRIAAAASVAALTHTDDCAPSRTVPYIGFHGTDDAVVPYAGGGESSLAPGEVIALFELEIVAEFAEFAADAGCDADPAVTELSVNVTSFDYSGCENDIAMTFYEIQGGGHNWPGSLVSLAISEVAGLGVTTDEINASETSWDFFEQYSLDS